MEDPDAEETKKFVEEQNEVSLPYIQSYEHRQTINQRLTDLWNYPKFGVPHKEGSKYFFSKNSGLQNQRYFTSTTIHLIGSKIQI